MRKLYREKRYNCGDYLEVDVFPVFGKQQGGRKRRAKPTSEAQAALNAHNAEKRLLRIINANFTEEDIKLELTYRPGEEPETDEEAQRDGQNFIRRLKRFRKKQGLPELKYIATVEKGTRRGRHHFHAILSGGVLPADIARIWGKGYVRELKPLQFDENGVAGLAWYFCGNKRGKRVDPLLYRRYNSSRNLIIPEGKERDGRISQKKMAEFMEGTAHPSEVFEKLYPGYIFSELEIFHNDVNGGYYICARMYKKDSAFLKHRKRRRHV